MEQPNGKIEHRLSVLETKVDTIMSNHLPHIQARLDSLFERMERQRTWLIGLLGGIIVSLFLLVVNLFIK